MLERYLVSPQIKGESAEAPKVEETNNDEDEEEEEDDERDPVGEMFIDMISLNSYFVLGSFFLKPTLFPTFGTLPLLIFFNFYIEFHSSKITYFN